MTAWTGFLRRAGDGGIEGRLVDEWGWTLTLTGTPGERDGRRGYILQGSLEPPATLWFDALDEPADSERTP